MVLFSLMFDLRDRNRIIFSKNILVRFRATCTLGRSRRGHPALTSSHTVSLAPTRGEGDGGVLGDVMAASPCDGEEREVCQTWPRWQWAGEPWS